MTNPGHPFLQSDAAACLEVYVSELARVSLVGSKSSTDVQALFGALGQVFLRSIAGVARDWNSARDRLRALPAELREMCLVSLPLSDKLRLAEVCTGWRLMSNTSPGLWSRIDTDGRPCLLTALLARSGQMPLDITLHMKANQDLRGIDGCLRAHSHRLRSLHFTFDDIDLSCINMAFRFAAPALEAFCLTRTWISGAGTWRIPPKLSLSPELFDNNAPKLRSLALDCFELPPSRALIPVQSASISGHFSMDNRLFELMPALRRLELSGITNPALLPAVHAQPLLQSLSIRDIDMPVQHAVDLGYLRLPDFSWSFPELSLVLDAVSTLADTSLWPGSVLSVHSTSEVDLCVSRNGAVARFSAFFVFPEEIRAAFGDGAQFARIRHLVLPMYLDVPPPRLDLCAPECFLLRGIVQLPHLESLTIRCGKEVSHVYSLIDPGAIRGIVSAPVLSRIVIDRDREQPGAAAGVLSEHLAHFIMNTIQVGDRSSLQLVIDTASGVRIHSADGVGGEFAQLRHCVGSIVL